MRTVHADFIAAEIATTRDAVELYDLLLPYATTEDWKYVTSSDTALTSSASKVYNPAPISRGNIQYSEELNAEVVEIYMHRTMISGSVNNLINIPLELLRIKITKTFRAHAGDANYESLIFWGLCNGYSLRDNELVLRFVSYKHLLETPMPLYRFGRICNWRFASTECGISLATHRHGPYTFDIGSDGMQIGSPAIFGAIRSAHWANYLLFGYVTIGLNSNYRSMITMDTGVAVTLHKPLYGYPTGGSAIANMYVYAGCDGNFETCKLFENTARFGGFPWIPISDVGIKL